MNKNTLQLGGDRRELRPNTAEQSLLAIRRQRIADLQAGMAALVVHGLVREQLESGEAQA